MSLEIEELKAQIIRRFKRRLTKLGIDRVELVTDEPNCRAVHPCSFFKRLQKQLSVAIVVRACEVALLLSVVPTIFPNFRLNYEKPVHATLVCINSIRESVVPQEPTSDPFAPLSPVKTEMAVDTRPPQTPIPPEGPDFKLDLRRPCRGRSRISS